MSLSKPLGYLDDNLTPNTSDIETEVNEELNNVESINNEEVNNEESEEEIEEIVTTKVNEDDLENMVNEINNEVNEDETVVEEEKGPSEEELIEDALEIMLKQVNISRDHAIRFIKENNYDPVDAILAYYDYKPEKEQKTYFDKTINPYELINELVSISTDLKKVKQYIISELSIMTPQTYFCIIINNGLRKQRKYGTIQKITEEIIGLGQTRLMSFKIYSEYYGLIYNKENITKEPKFVNKELTVILRNSEIITEEEFYDGTGLFINNCFLN